MTSQFEVVPNFQNTPFKKGDCVYLWYDSTPFSGLAEIIGLWLVKEIRPNTNSQPSLILTPVSETRAADQFGIRFEPVIKFPYRTVFKHEEYIAIHQEQAQQSNNMSFFAAVLKAQTQALQFCDDIFLNLSNPDLPLNSIERTELRNSIFQTLVQQLTRHYQSS
ncbi:hypothetical protein ACQ4M3_29170 [Leptolyngbya sp. AN03gr2]|uniref:hypothetical protein n=1 Tax=unclassified Leptolyngbya TaxID=2650499 RepID=UPI003D31F0FA